MLPGGRKEMPGMKFLIINGPNLNLLGKRQPEIYGRVSLDEINQQLKSLAAEYRVALEFFQSNSEGEIIDVLHRAGTDKTDIDCIILNPGALTHYSYALADAVAAISIPVIEVHLSNIYGREKFRRESVVASVATGQITGFGPASYIAAFYAALYLLGKEMRRI
jgi:3-dehydroquinate dehydratase-2